MAEFTDTEKELILMALNRLFVREAVSGDLAAVEQAVALARSIERKLTKGNVVLPSDHTDLRNGGTQVGIKKGHRG